MPIVMQTYTVSQKDYSIGIEENGWIAYDEEGDQVISAPKDFTQSQFERLIRAYEQGLRDGERMGRYKAKAEIRKALEL